MTTDDRAQFALAMTRLFAIYGDELTDALLDSWWGVLQGYDLREIRLAMNCHATDPQWGHRRPAPSDLIRHLTETLPARRREAHVQRVRALRERIEPLDSKMRSLRTAVALGVINDDERLEKARREYAGLEMQVAALNRELALLVDDRPRLTGPSREPVALAAVLPHHPGNVDPTDPT